MTADKNQEGSAAAGPLSRRKFIGQAGAMALGATALSGMHLNLDAVRAAAMENPDTTGYKALVCILLSGGNDSFNMLVPHDEHASYVEARGGLYTRGNGGVAMPLGQLLTIGDGEFAVHQSLADIPTMYDSGELAFLANAGPLVAPIIDGTTRIPLTVSNSPRGLFSHRDQIDAWQVVGGSGTGVLGRVDDVYDAPATSDLASISSSISVAGTNLMQRGASSRHYTISLSGPVKFNGAGVDPTRSRISIQAAIGTTPGSSTPTLYNGGYGGPFKEAYARHMETAVANADAFSTGYQTAFANSAIDRDYFNRRNTAAAQLEAVVRSIEMQQVLAPIDQVSRQIFFVRFGGWDDHDALIAGHGPRLAALNEAMFQFSEGLKAIGRWSDVTTFTASDFGRTLRSNGTGTDHGWGGNHMIMGGAVQGGTIYGEYPNADDLMPNSFLDLATDGNGAGRLIPTTSADEYLAELALWFGVPASRLLEVLPNLGEFYSPSSATAPIGFMS
ncbi:MAG: DUF1501 domain-containing protein [Actinomycetota bacterium]